MTFGCSKNYSYISVLCDEVKESGQESEGLMLCLVSDTDHLYGLVVSSLCVCFCICKIGRMPIMPIPDVFAQIRFEYMKTLCMLLNAMKHKISIDYSVLSTQLTMTHLSLRVAFPSTSMTPGPQLDLLHHSTHLPTIDWTRTKHLILDGPIRFSVLRI